MHSIANESYKSTDGDFIHKMQRARANSFMKRIAQVLNAKYFYFQQNEDEKSG